MRAKFVNESLDRFALLDENFLAENVLNEKLDINVITNKAKKLGVLAAMFLMFVGGKAPELQSKMPSNDQISRNPIMQNMAGEDHLSRDDVFDGFANMLSLYKGNKNLQPKILSTSSTGFIDDVNKINPNRLDSSKTDRYDGFDEDILKAVKNLQEKGEEVNPDLIKAIMIIETGMKPVKNRLGYEGFPQTKQHIIDGVNERNGTSFTMKDMYNPEKSAEFIHYFIKTIEKSKFVKNTSDMVIAYNWGIGNLGKYKKGEKKLPQETKDYVDIFKTMEKYFVS